MCLSRPQARRFAPWPLLFAALALCGCSDSGTSTQEAPGPRPAPAVGPRATVEKILTLRSERRYADLRTHIKPDHAAELVATLVAVDDLLDANAKLQEWVSREVGSATGRMIDQDYIADALGVFSRNVELLDEATFSAEATVTFTVNGQLPAQVARLVRVEDAWRYDPEGGFSPALPAAFHELARGLERTQHELASGRWDAELLAREPERLLRLIESNLRPGLRKLGEARAALEDSKP